MNSNLLRKLWDLIESTQAETLTQLDDRQLVHILVADLQAQNSLKDEELISAIAYIRSRLLLIRESAQARQDLYCPVNLQRRATSVLRQQTA